MKNNPITPRILQNWGGGQGALALLFGKIPFVLLLPRVSIKTPKYCERKERLSQIVNLSSVLRGQRVGRLLGLLSLSSPSEPGTACLGCSQPPVPSILFSGTEIGRVHILLLIPSSIQFYPQSWGTLCLCSTSYLLHFSKVCTLGSGSLSHSSLLLQEGRKKMLHSFHFSPVLFAPFLHSLCHPLNQRYIPKSVAHTPQSLVKSSLVYNQCWWRDGCIPV